MNSHVIIVGGGIAGLTTALALSQVEIPTLVLERLNFEDESGAGIQLTPNATRVLFQLGLQSALVPVSHEPEILETRHWRTGNVLCRVPLRQIVAQYCEFPYLQILRSDLIEILRRKCLNQTNITLMDHVEVTDIEQSENGVSLHSSNEIFSAPMVIGADGTHSTMSALIGNTQELEFSGWQAWRTVLSDLTLSSPGLRKTNVWCGKAGHIVHYPVNSNRTYNFVFVTKSNQTLSGKWKQRGSVAELGEYFRDWHHSVRETIEQIDQQRLFRWGLFHHARTKHAWSSQRIVLLGDAIHATMPFLAQGAALAIEDASTIANRLKSDSKNIEKVIELFVESRRPRVERIQKRSEKMGVIFHLGLPWSMIRDLGTRWAIKNLARDIYRFRTV